MIFFFFLFPEQESESHSQWLVCETQVCLQLDFGVSILWKDGELLHESGKIEEDLCECYQLAWTTPATCNQGKKTGAVDK